MTNDTIQIRIDLERIRELLRMREGVTDDNREAIVDKMVAAYQHRMEEQTRDLERGQGEFEACFFDAL